MTEVRRTQPDPTAAAVRAAQAEAEALREAADALDTRAGQLHEAYAEAKRGLKIGSGLLRDRADRLATDTAAPEGVLSEEYAENLIGFVRTFETGEAAASALPIFLRTATRPAAPVAVEGVETVAAVRVGFRYQDGGVLSPEREAASEDVELPVAVLDLGDGEWLTLGEIRDLRAAEWSPVEPETSEPEGGESR